MKRNRTELVFILDRSGSMSGLESDTIGGFNAMLAKQKAVEGECRITSVLFDNTVELLHDRIDIKAIRPITEDDYCVGGSTALLDAVGMTIRKVENAQRQTAEDYRADKVMVVIITDGEENASREFRAGQIRRIISRLKEQQGWEFIFLGANIDAVQSASHFGISPDRAQDFHADRKGVETSFRVMTEAVTSFRSQSSLPEDWNAEIRQDYKKRGKN